MLGGRTNHWGRISLRFGPKDFKRRSIDGLGDDWPIGYEDIKPYYDKVDELIGVFGTNEGLENDPDGIFLPPPKPRLHELMIKNAAATAKVPVIPSRLSILTKKITSTTERGACFGYGDLVVDFRGFRIMAGFGCPVFFDATHSVQRPGGAETGGQREFIPLLARAAVAAGVDGIFLETHPDPAKARSDRDCQWPLSQVEPLLRSLLKIRAAAADTVKMEAQRA